MFGFPTSAMVLPRSVAVSLEITDAKGSQAWNCVSSGGGSHPSGVPDKDSGRAYGIYLDPSQAPIGQVDGIFALKAPLTASPPAINDIYVFGVIAVTQAMLPLLRASSREQSREDYRPLDTMQPQVTPIASVSAPRPPGTVKKYR